MDEAVSRMRESLRKNDFGEELGLVRGLLTENYEGFRVGRNGPGEICASNEVS